MQAVENEPWPESRIPPLIDLCLKQERLRLTAPVPLGDQRQRFLALAGDMQRRKDSYLSQLSMLTLAHLNRRDQTDARQAILAGLLPQGADAAQQTDDLLWQARLVLKLGELYDREQEELRQAMQQITARQEDLLAELREESDSPFSLTVGISEPQAEGADLLGLRARAWSRLFLHHSDGFLPGFCLTSHQTAMDTLQEVYEKRSRTSSRLLGSLALPLHAAAPAEISLPEPLARRCPDLHAALVALSGGSPTPERADLLPSLLQQGLAAWSREAPKGLLAPGEKATLDIVFFPEISIEELLREGWYGGGHAAARQTAGGSGCCVGLLRLPRR